MKPAPASTQDTAPHAPRQAPTALAGPLRCRVGCGACCTAPSISSPIPGMPGGKPAGVPCVQLDPQLRCRLFGQVERPAVCVSLRPTPEMCGQTREQAVRFLSKLEAMTLPTVAPPGQREPGGAA